MVITEDVNTLFLAVDVQLLYSEARWLDDLHEILGFSGTN
jgi:hypothetical protein